MVLRAAAAAHGSSGASSFSASTNASDSDAPSISSVENIDLLSSLLDSEESSADLDADLASIGNRHSLILSSDSLILMDSMPPPASSSSAGVMPDPVPGSGHYDTVNIGGGGGELAGMHPQPKKHPPHPPPSSQTHGKGRAAGLASTGKSFNRSLSISQTQISSPTNPTKGGGNRGPAVGGGGGGGGGRSRIGSANYAPEIVDHEGDIKDAFGGSATLSSPPSSLSSRTTVFPATSPLRSRAGAGGGGGVSMTMHGAMSGGGAGVGGRMKGKRDSLHSSMSSEYQIPSPLGSGSVCGSGSGSAAGSVDYEQPPKPVARKSSLVGVGIPTNSIKVTDT